MVYIVEVNPKGFKEYSQTSVFDTYKQALKHVDDFCECHGNECEYRIYEAVNEYTSNRKLLLEC